MASSLANPKSFKPSPAINLFASLKPTIRSLITSTLSLSCFNEIASTSLAPVFSLMYSLNLLCSSEAISKYWFEVVNLSLSSVMLRAISPNFFCKTANSSCSCLNFSTLVEPYLSGYILACRTISLKLPLPASAMSAIVLRTLNVSPCFCMRIIFSCSKSRSSSIRASSSSPTYDSFNSLALFK